MATKLRVGTLGTCPVCEGEFKARASAMVHHGFERPGDGRIHGDCFAVGLEPYELSTKGCEAYKASCASSLAGLETFLVEIPTRTSWTKLVPLYGGGRAFDMIDLAVGVTDHYVWVRFVESKIADTEGQIRGLRSEIERMDRRIAAWTLQPLREVTEEAAEAQIAETRNMRAAIRAGRARLKEDKAAALKAKRDAREAVREAAFQTFVDELTAIAGLTEGREDRAREAWTTFFSKRNARKLGCLSRFYYGELPKRGFDPLLITLGLAWRSSPHYVIYRYGIQ